MAPLGVLSSSGRMNLVDAAGFINPLLMERIMCWLQGIFDGLHLTADLYRTPDPHNDCPFNGHSRQMRDLHRHHAPCPCLKKRPQTGLLWPYPGILGHFVCFRRIGGFGLDFGLGHRGRHLYFSDHRAAHQSQMESDCLCLRNRLGPQDFWFHQRGSDFLCQPSLHAPVGFFCLNSEEDY